MFQITCEVQHTRGIQRHGEIVSSPKAVLLMREMAAIGHPAVDTLHHIPDLCRLLLYIDNKDADWSDSVRQLIGHMCRQIMEQLGYTKVQDDAPVYFSNIFQGGAVYKWNEK